MSEYVHAMPDGSVIIIGYERTPRDTYKVEFAGELLRDEVLDWSELAKALQEMARVPSN